MMKESSNWKFDKIKLTGYILILLAIIFALVTRLCAIFQYITFDIGPDPDQIRDAFAVMEIWKGNLPTLGPKVTTIGSHHILPLYYYLFFPFTMLGADPVFQALPNGLFSFLSVLLFIYLIYELLENTKTSLRVFLSGLGGLWYSVLFGDFFISNFQWNPSSIPFFLLLMTWFYKQQMENKYSFSKQVILWTCYGFVLAIFISLHSSTLFIIPVVFVITSLAFIYKSIKRAKKLLLLPFISLLASIITLSPYWMGEIGRGFKNTKSIIKTIVSSSTSSDGFFLTNLLNKVGNLLLNYFHLAQQSYFWNGSGTYLLISTIFLSTVSYLGITKFRGNGTIWLLWCSTWLIFLIASANVNSNEMVFFYKSLISFAPIVLTIVTLAYSDYSSIRKTVLVIFLAIIIALSFYQNLLYDYRFMLSKYGERALISTRDITSILKQLPSKSIICDPRIKRKRERYNQYNYIDTYITQKGIKVTKSCEIGNYIIHPKRIMLIESNFINDVTYKKPYFVKSNSSSSVNLFPTFKLGKNQMIQRSVELVEETQTAYIYRLTEEK